MFPIYFIENNEYIYPISEVLPGGYLSIKYRFNGETRKNKIAISHTVLYNYLKYGGTGQFSYLLSVFPLFNTFLIRI